MADPNTTKLVRAIELDDGQTVQIIGKHPWAGERGTLVAFENYGPPVFGFRGWRVALDNGTECYADARSLRSVR